ncbi:hypothetical protein TAESTU_10695 [Tenacibaculum aestuarii]
MTLLCNFKQEHLLLIVKISPIPFFSFNVCFSFTFQSSNFLKVKETFTLTTPTYQVSLALFPVHTKNYSFYKKNKVLQIKTIQT